MDLFKENEEPEIETKKVDPETGISISSEKLNGINLDNLNCKSIKSKVFKDTHEKKLKSAFKELDHFNQDIYNEKEMMIIDEELPTEIQEILFNLDSINKFLENDLN